jgi:hypothetical protein
MVDIRLCRIFLARGAVTKGSGFTNVELPSAPWPVTSNLEITSSGRRDLASYYILEKVDHNVGIDPWTSTSLSQLPHPNGRKDVLS